MDRKTPFELLKRRGHVTGPHPGHFDPALHQLGSLRGFERAVAQAGGDDTVGDAVELGHSGPDGGSQVLLPLLVSLRPDAPQTVVWDHLLKQLLRVQFGVKERREGWKVERKGEGQVK